jgi:hypothetical protein
MSIGAKKIIFRRLVREYEFLVEDLQDIEQANNEIKDSFMKSLTDIDQDGILQTDEMDNMADDWAKSVKEHEDLEKESNKHPDFKGLFRKVVVKCHPDKLDSNMTVSELSEYKYIYEQAVSANETEDWAQLIMAAMKLGVEIPESAYDQIESIEKSINKLKEKQTNILNSIAWTWYKTNNSDTKSDILKQHLDFMALITKKQN